MHMSCFLTTNAKYNADYISHHQNFHYYDNTIILKLFVHLERISL